LIDVEYYEKKLRGEDDEAVREILKEIQEEKKGHQFKQVQKFDIEKFNLQVINELDIESFDDITGEESTEQYH